jgi:hypothetical protein
MVDQPREWLISLEKSLAGCKKVEQAGEAWAGWRKVEKAGEASTVWRKVEQTGED